MRFAMANATDHGQSCANGGQKVWRVLDLAIAIGLLAAQEILPIEILSQFAFIAELGLDGSLRPVRGATPLVLATTDRKTVVALENLGEASAATTTQVFAVQTLFDVVECLSDRGVWQTASPKKVLNITTKFTRDLADVQGQPAARQALEISAAGSHHLLLVGPPGAGKTMLAERLVGLCRR